MGNFKLFLSMWEVIKTCRESVWNSPGVGDEGTNTTAVGKGREGRREGGREGRREGERERVGEKGGKDPEKMHREEGRKGGEGVKLGRKGERRKYHGWGKNRIPIT